MNDSINIEAGDMGLVIAFVLLIGGIIKNFTPVNNKWIPLITWALGGLLYQWLAGGWTDPRQWMMALISVAGATGLHAATKSTFDKTDSTDGPPPAVHIPPANHFGVWVVVAALSLGLLGCASPQRPPSAAEQKYFEIKTNVVEVVSWVTNTAEVSSGQVSSVNPVTNRVEQYDFTPNANARAVAGTASAVTSMWSPAAGGVVGAALMGIFSLWGLVRSKQRETANQITAEELAQIIETGRQILLKLPDGARYEAAYKAWMVKHQADAGVIGQVAELVALAVDNDKAKGAALTIVNLIQQTKA